MRCRMAEQTHVGGCCRGLQLFLAVTRRFYLYPGRGFALRILLRKALQLRASCAECWWGFSSSGSRTLTDGATATQQKLRERVVRTRSDAFSTSFALRLLSPSVTLPLYFPLLLPFILLLLTATHCFLWLVSICFLYPPTLHTAEGSISPSLSLSLSQYLCRPPLCVSPYLSPYVSPSPPPSFRPSLTLSISPLSLHAHYFHHVALWRKHPSIYSLPSSVTISFFLSRLLLWLPRSLCPWIPVPNAGSTMFYFQLVIMAGTVLLAYYFEYTDTFPVHVQGFFCFDKAYSKPYPGPEDNSKAPPVIVYSLVTAIPTVTVSFPPVVGQTVEKCLCGMKLLLRLLLCPHVVVVDGREKKAPCAVWAFILVVSPLHSRECVLGHHHGNPALYLFLRRAASRSCSVAEGPQFFKVACF